MPKGSYITTVFFLSTSSSSSFFLLYFRRLISEVNVRISTKLGHIFTYDCYLKNVIRSLPGIYPLQAWGRKAPFLGPTLNFDQTYLCNGTSHQQSERSLSIYRDSPTFPPKLVNFGQETAVNVWRVFAPPPKFSHWETQSLPHVI